MSKKNRIFAKKFINEPIRNNMIFYFSGLGNSKHVAQNILLEDERLFFIPEVERANISEFTINEGERLGFVFPVYSWRAPRLVSEFVAKMQLIGTPGYTFLVTTCGDDCGKTEAYFRKDLQRKGIKLDAAIAIQMPNTYVNLPGMDVDPIEVSNEKLRKAEPRIAEVKAMLERKEKVSQMIITGAAGLKSDIIQPLFYKLLVTDKKFHTTDACVGCGVCADNCPLLNITIENGRPRWHGHCTTCMSCYHHCHHHAIQFGKATDKKGQYYFTKLEK